MSTEESETPQAGIILLGAMTAMTPMSIDAYLPALPSLSRDLSASSSVAQLTLTALLGGLAFGQLVIGPISDRVGRRPPVFAGLAGFVVASLLCAVAPSIEVLIALRFLQGASGAAAVVVARAVVRDLHGGTAAARVYAALMLVLGVAPIVAPIAGAQLLKVTSWRGVFVALALMGGLLLASTARWLPESLPAERRQPGRWRTTMTVFGHLLTDRQFTGYALAGGLGFAAMFAYISGSSFVLQDIYGLSPQAFSGVFAMNAAGLILLSQVSARTVHRTGPRPLLLLGLVLSATGGIGIVVSVLIGAGLAGVLPSLFVVVSAVGLTSPNATALALAEHGRTAGAASALVGVVQYVLGASAAPLVGLAGSHTAVPMAVTIAVAGAAGLAATALTRTPRRVSG
ncbi:MAG TPA: Bcr/CflA family multidrug efflux MFS transporter [Mycobacteriales bacterium]|nr:Bcr/CflA family multidrug efflux MFS transporter [Mycobacteriales bacterium]